MGLRRVVHGGYRDNTPIMENHMEKNIGNWGYVAGYRD